MSDTSYNGWANYATWRVQMEIIDGLDFSDETRDRVDLAEALKSLVEDRFDEAPNGLVKDFAFAFLADVDWLQIAHRMKDWNDAR